MTDYIEGASGNQLVSAGRDGGFARKGMQAGREQSGPDECGVGS